MYNNNSDIDKCEDHKCKPIYPPCVQPAASIPAGVADVVSIHSIDMLILAKIKLI